MKIIAIAVILLSATVGYNQEKSDSTKKEYTWGISLDRRLSFNFSNPLNSNFLTQDSPLSLMATLSNEKHQFEFGPQFSFNVGGFRNLTGIGLNYKYYPRGYNNRFNSYFLASFSYMHGNYEWTESKLDNSTNTYFNGDMRFKYNSTIARIGYGIDFNISNKFYLGMNVGISGTASYINLKSTFPENTSFNYQEIFRNQQINGFVGLNIGYRF